MACGNSYSIQLSGSSFHCARAAGFGFFVGNSGSGEQLFRALCFSIGDFRVGPRLISLRRCELELRAVPAWIN